MEKLTNDGMRQLFSSLGLKYALHVTYDNVVMLHSILVQELHGSDCFEGTYRMNKNIEFKVNKRKKSRDFIFAGLTCNAFYFTGREAVSFNSDGFIGFCGWSDSYNDQPILRGFKKWCEWLCSNQLGQKEPLQ